LARVNADTKPITGARSAMPNSPRSAWRSRAAPANRATSIPERTMR